MSSDTIFALPVFFICLRECLETSIVVSILLAFVKKAVGEGPDKDLVTYKKLRKQIWIGTVGGVFVCFLIGAGMIGAFYGLGTNSWSTTEDVWEGAFALIASIVITLMGAALLRVSKMQDKWKVKLAKALEARDGPPIGTRSNRFKIWCEKYALLILPLITVLREGLEAVVFIGGVGVGLPATSFPLAVVCGLGAGALIGYCIYRGGNRASIQIFLIISTCFLYLVAAGLFSRAVWSFEQNAWNRLTGGDAAETGSGPGSYDIRNSVWHVNCCSPLVDGGGGWGVFNSLLGWQNSATYGSVISYNLYWIAVIMMFIALRFKETRGRWPLMKPKAQSSSAPSDLETTSGVEEQADAVKTIGNVSSSETGSAVHMVPN